MYIHMYAHANQWQIYCISEICVINGAYIDILRRTADSLLMKYIISVSVCVQVNTQKEI